MEYNKVAAKWWADKLRNINIEENNNIGAYSKELETILASQTHPEEEAIARFEQSLAETIKNLVESYGHMTLSVNYMPDYILCVLAQKSGIFTNVFPLNTTMLIYPDKISICIGSGVHWETIFSADSTTN